MTHIIGSEPAVEKELKRAKCPHCGAQPIKYTVTPASTPDGSVLFIEVMCDACENALPVMAMMNPAMPQKGPSPFGPHVKH